MKYLLLLLLFCSLCTAQQQYKNYTKVTAYRLVNTDETGPCSIEYYAKHLKRTGHYIQAMESYNDTLAYNLLRLKEEASRQPKDTCRCGEESAGKVLVPNMLIVEINSHKDTVFTTEGHKAVFFPKEQHSVALPAEMESIFPQEMTEFFQRDFAREIEAWKIDAIPAKSVILDKKPFYGLTRKQFEKEIAFFETATTDSVFMPNGYLISISRACYLEDAKFTFNENNGKIREVLITKSQTPARRPISLDGVKVGDPEEVLCSKYDNSTLLKHWDAPLSAIGNYYTYELELENNAGKVLYVIRNKAIHTIHISFNYPEKK